jgi:hypothetical protein
VVWQKCTDVSEESAASANMLLTDTASPSETSLALGATPCLYNDHCKNLRSQTVLWLQLCYWILGACGTYGRQEKCIKIWKGDLIKKDHLKDFGIEGKIVLQWIFKKCDGEAWAGLIWFRIGTFDECL